MGSGRILQRLWPVLAFAVVAGASPAWTATSCLEERYLLRASELPLLRSSAPRTEPMLFTGDQIDLLAPATDCRLSSLRRSKKSNGGIVIRARWRCPAIRGLVRLRATIDAECRALSGTLVARKEPRRAFVARKSKCGDGVVDPARSEQCDSPDLSLCDSKCRVLCGDACSCTGDLKVCPGARACVNGFTDVENCGDCGRRCGGAANANPACVAGSCSLECRRPFGNCDQEPGNGCEVDLLADPKNCGACGRECSAPAGYVPICTNGRCGTACPDGLLDCDASIATGCEVDGRDDVDNCGTCRNQCPAGPNAVPYCQGRRCGVTCTVPGQQSCDGRNCVDTGTDARNCGGCANRCPQAAVCSAGQCVCPAGLNVCSGVCTDRQTDPGNCGTCGRECPPVQVCQQGRCVCPPTGGICNNLCVDFATDVNNCGTCGNICRPGEVCASGQCVCPEGKDVCSGVCTNTDTDPRNCGSCGEICPSGYTCAEGDCLCAEGKTICGVTKRCVNLDTDPSNCGRCGTICNPGFDCSIARCVCPLGKRVCDGACVNPQVDSNNCGQCGKICPSDKTCVDGDCVCADGLTLCNSRCTNTNTDRRNCGRCNRNCGTGEVCISGACF